jgi:hypothetical protein
MVKRKTVYENQRRAAAALDYVQFDITAAN